MEIARLLGYLLRMSRGFHLSGAAAALPAAGRSRGMPTHVRTLVMIGVAMGSGLIAGLGLTGWLAIISTVLATPPGHRDRRLLYAFIACCIAVPACRLISQTLFNVITTRAVFATRLACCRRILAAPLRLMEEVGSHRLLVTLTEDITTLSGALSQVPLLCLQVGVVGACLGYMGWLSWRLLLGVLGCMIVGSLTYGFSMGLARKYFSQLREELDTLFGHCRSLIYGAKELKLHGPRRRAFIASSLIPSGERIQRSTAVANNILAATAVWGNLLLFIVVGALVFLFRDGASTQARVITGFTLCLLYMLSPLEVIFQLMPMFGRAAAAVRKLDRLGLDLASPVAETATAEEADAGAAWNGGSGRSTGASAWRRLEVAGVAYRYTGDTPGEHFGVGPLDLTFRPGEVVFITGGNGSGKSTFLKLLTGLYVPDAGEMALDGAPITSDNRESYRQLFSTVFADFHLFESLLGLPTVGLDEAARDYIGRLQLEKKVKVENGVLSTLDLSQGQRKRLALLTAFLERRPIYVFDEWAADQDPQFKAVFYFEILPELKALGATIFVVSHDDQYYSLADRLIKMKDGLIEWDRAPAAAQEPVNLARTLSPTR